jgi:hypothetical protein
VSRGTPGVCEDALEIGTKLVELRATTASRASLPVTAGHDEAQAGSPRSKPRSTEGVDTPDPQDAKALLKELE